MRLIYLFILLSFLNAAVSGCGSDNAQIVAILPQPGASPVAMESPAPSPTVSVIPTPLTSQQIQMIRDWVQRGAPNN